MNEKYDIRGRVRRLEQRKDWNLGLENLLNDDSFDVEFSPSGQILRLTTYNMAGDVIGSEQFVYSDSGKITSSLEFDSAGRQTHANCFVHQNEGNQVITASEKDGKFTGRTVEIFDGSMVLSFAFYDAKNFLMKEKAFQYIYNKLHSSETKFFVSDGRLVERWLSSYDSEGRIVETYGLNGDSEPLGDGRYKYEYTPQGRIGRVWTFDDLVPDGPASGLKMYEYVDDEAGNWV